MELKHRYQNPIANFFGLPILVKNLNQYNEYQVILDNIDDTWIPTTNNLLGNLKIYFKGVGNGTAPTNTNYINWKSSCK